MRKFRLEKDLGMTKIGGIFDIEGYYYGDDITTLFKFELNEEIRGIIKYADYFPEYFEEIFTLKEILPKFKIGDCVVANKNQFFGDVYIKIHSIHNIDNEFTYNFEKFRENNLRLPTEEELKKYFR